MAPIGMYLTMQIMLDVGTAWKYWLDGAILMVLTIAYTFEDNDVTNDDWNFVARCLTMTYWDMDKYS